MKKKYVFLTLAFVFVCVLKMQAQNLETDIMKVLSQDETVLSFSKDESISYVTRDGQPSLEEHNELTSEPIKQAERKQWTVNG